MRTGTTHVSITDLVERRLVYYIFADSIAREHPVPAKTEINLINLHHENEFQRSLTRMR